MEDFNQKLHTDKSVSHESHDWKTKRSAKHKTAKLQLNHCSTGTLKVQTTLNSATTAVRQPNRTKSRCLLYRTSAPKPGERQNRELINCGSNLLNYCFYAYFLLRSIEKRSVAFTNIFKKYFSAAIFSLDAIQSQCW